MANSEIVMQNQPKHVAHLIEHIDALWPKYRAVLDLPPQELRATWANWCEWVPKEAESVHQRYLKDAELDDSGDGALWARYLQLREINSVLELPEDIALSARKRLFGALPPQDDEGDFLLSEDELLVLAGAFWRDSQCRFYYAELVQAAEAKAKRIQKVERTFRDLRKELG